MTISDKVVFFGAGCGVGLVLGALFAPKSGMETRQDLTKGVDDLTQKVQEKIQSSGIKDTATQTWQNVMEKGKNVANIGRRRFNESVEAAKNKMNESIEDEDIAER